MYIIRYQAQRQTAHQITDVSWRLGLFAAILPALFQAAAALKCSSRMFPVCERALREKLLHENEVKVASLHEVEN